MLLGWLLLLAPDASATSWAASPPTVQARLHAAARAGEFTVLSTTTVFVDGKLPVTPARLVDTARGTDEVLVLILPGGVVDGRFRRLVPDGFEVQAGETLFVFLTEAEGMPGYFNTAYSFADSVYRRTETSRGALIADPYGRFVVDLPCDDVPLRAVVPKAPVESLGGPDRDEAGTAVEASGLRPGFLEIDDPESVAIGWDEAVAALAFCGGVR